MVGYKMQEMVERYIKEADMLLEGLKALAEELA